MASSPTTAVNCLTPEDDYQRVDWLRKIVRGLILSWCDEERQTSRGDVVEHNRIYNHYLGILDAHYTHYQSCGEKLTFPPNFDKEAIRENCQIIIKKCDNILARPEHRSAIHEFDIMVVKNFQACRKAAEDRLESL